MYKTVLVESDIEIGDRLLRSLDRKDISITAAFWLYSEDANEWRLMLVSPLVSTIGPRELYHAISTVLKESDLDVPVGKIFLLSPNDLRYKQVRLASIGVPSGFKVTKGPARNISLEDAYVYRMM